MSKDALNPFEAVEFFHEHFRMFSNHRPGPLNPHLFQVRTTFIGEELNEYVTAHAEGNLPETLDALIDLMYVIIGTGLLHGWSAEDLQEAFRRVHKANMKKIKVRHEGESKRGTLYDVKKPKDWLAPDLSDLCERDYNTPYPLHCMHPDKCKGLTNCPRDPICVD